MRTTLRTVVALATMLGLFLPAATSLAAASITLSTSSGALGSSTTVSGGGFAASTTVRILFGGSGSTQIGSESSDASGNLPGLAVTIPNVTGGMYQVLATDGNNSASVNFTVPFSLSLSPGSGGAGTTITVSGMGFLANEGVTVGWDQTNNDVATATANGSGAFTTSFAAPSGTGNHPVFATGHTSHFTLATTFTLSGTGNVGGANLSITPDSGRAGSQVNLNGTGFGGSEQVNLTVDGSILTSVTADGNGGFTTAITLPSSLTFGLHTIAASGVSSGHSSLVVFSVTSGRPGERERATPVSCTDDNTRPGNGLGDRNHCHTGPPGNEHGNGHGHGHHGNQGDDADDQGDDD
jgi:hypothetical protein